MVKTVGPASMRVPSTGTERILPPGASALSTTVTDNPARASFKAAARPPIPAPITTARAGDTVAEPPWTGLILSFSSVNYK